MLSCLHQLHLLPPFLQPPVLPLEVLLLLLLLFEYMLLLISARLLQASK